jgi:hypothetical protein
MGDGGKRELEVILKRQQVILLPCALHVIECVMSWTQNFRLLCILQFQLACQNAFNVSPTRLQGLKSRTGIHRFCDRAPELQ